MTWTHAALIAALLFGGVACSSSEPTPAEEPAEERTTAERLVGSWEVVSFDGKELTEQGLESLTMTFTADGHWTQEAVASGEPDSKRADYVVEGNTVTLTEPGDTNGSFTVDFTGDDELDLQQGEQSLKLRRAK